MEMIRMPMTMSNAMVTMKKRLSQPSWPSNQMLPRAKIHDGLSFPTRPTLLHSSHHQDVGILQPFGFYCGSEFQTEISDIQVKTLFRKKKRPNQSNQSVDNIKDLCLTKTLAIDLLGFHVSDLEPLNVNASSGCIFPIVRVKKSGFQLKPTTDLTLDSVTRFWPESQEFSRRSS